MTPDKELVTSTIKTPAAAAEKDGGCRGWVIVFASFTVHVMLYGIALTYGILVPSLVEYFDSGRAVVGGIASLMIGFSWIAGPLASVVVNRCGYRTTALIGSLMSVSGFVMSAFTPNVPMLYFSYSVLGGVGGSLMYLPSIVIVSVYFERRRALATGFAVCGTGVGTIVFAPFVEYLLEVYGWRGTLLIEAGLLLNCCVCAAVYLPPPSTSPSSSPLHNDELVEDKFSSLKSESKFSCRQLFNWFLLTDFVFISFAVCNFVGCTSYVVPFIYLPDLGQVQVGLDARQTAVLILIIGISNTLIRIVIGYIADLGCVDRLAMFGANLVICGLSSAFVAHYNTFSLLAVYAVVFGIGIGIFTCLVPVILADLFGVECLPDSFGAILLCEGVATALGVPVAGMLFDYQRSYNDAFVFAGLTMIFSGIVALLAYVQRKICRISRKSPVVLASVR